MDDECCPMTSDILALMALVAHLRNLDSESGEAKLIGGAITTITSLTERAELAAAEAAVLREALKKAGAALDEGARATNDVHRLASQALSYADSATYAALQNTSTAAQELLAERDGLKNHVETLKRGMDMAGIVFAGIQSRLEQRATTAESELTALKSEMEKMAGSQRTVGTVEVCESCGRSAEEAKVKCYGRGHWQETHCPIIRSAAGQKRKGVWTI